MQESVPHDCPCTGIAIARTVGLIPPSQRVVLGSLSKTSNEVMWRAVSEPSGTQAGDMAAELAPADSQTDEINWEGVIKDGEGDQKQRQCSLAVTGDAFAVLLASGTLAQYMTCKGCCAPAMVHCMCPRIRVFGRMTPQQKIQAG